MKSMVTDQRLWKLSNELENPAVTNPELYSKSKSLGSVLIPVTEGLQNPQPMKRYLSLPSLEPMVKEDNFSNELTPSGLSRNHK